MKRTTYGGFPAARVLAERVEQLGDPHLRRRVSRRLNDFLVGLDQLLEVPARNYRRRLALLWRDAHLERVDFHPYLDSYVRNVMTTYAKDLLL